MKYMPRDVAFGKLKALSDAAAMMRNEVSQLSRRAPGRDEHAGEVAGSSRGLYAR